MGRGGLLGLEGPKEEGIEGEGPGGAGYPESYYRSQKQALPQPVSHIIPWGLRMSVSSQYTLNHAILVILFSFLPAAFASHYSRTVRI